MNQKGIATAVIGALAVLAAAAITSIDKWLPLVTGPSGPTQHRVEPTNAGASPAFEPVVNSLSLEKSVYCLPEDGAANNGEHIGPFCCSGVTATIKSSSGTPLGYAYAYDFNGGRNEGGSSYARSFSILVSGISHFPGGAQQKSEIAFNADEMSPGLKKSTQAGVLMFTARLESDSLENIDGKQYYNMETVKACITIELRS